MASIDIHTYQELRMARRPDQVISRFERGRFAHDEECYKQYIAALVETGQQHKVIPDIMQRLGRQGGGNSLDFNEVGVVC